VSTGLGQLPLHELQGRLRRARTVTAFQKINRAIDARLRLLNAQTRNWPRLADTLVADESGLGRSK